MTKSVDFQKYAERAASVWYDKMLFIIDQQL